jgi:hypothetical protein
MAFSIITSSANLAADSITIPLSTLDSFGLSSGERANTPADVQRAIFSALKAIQSESFTSVVGLAKPGAPTQANPAVNLLNNTFSLTQTLVADLTAQPNTIGLIPLPTAGTNNGIGGIGVADVFAGAAAQASGTSVTNVLAIPKADLSPFGFAPANGTNFASGDDDRNFFSALLQYLATSNDIALRTATVSSSVVARSLTAPGAGTLPANATAATNPTTGISADSRVLPIASTFTITFQQAINQVNETVDINFVTA